MLKVKFEVSVTFDVWYRERLCMSDPNKQTYCKIKA